jgi:tetratricopeptide (TPR) repeat protein
MAAARILLEGGDREGAGKMLMSAERSHPDRIDQRGLEYLKATANGDAGPRVKALQALAQVTPADSRVFGELADLQFSQRNFPKAAQNYEMAARLDPENGQAWNQLGYGYAFAQNLAAARRALEHYRQLQPPEETNPLDSLGEVCFYLGDFSTARKYFLQAHERNPSEFSGAELVKAAQAQLMLGDLPQADALFQRYISLIRHSQSGLAGYQQAQWEFLTGRRKNAIARLEKLIPSLDGDSKALGMCQLSIWKLATGDRQAAAALAGQAENIARSQRIRSLSVTSRLLATSPSGGTGSELTDAYALLFAQKFPQALPVLEKLFHQTNPNGDGQIRTLLAWAQAESGHLPEAQRLLDPTPIPLSSVEPLFAGLIFPRYLYLRGAVLDKGGKRAEAKRSYELFLKYAGDLPDIFGDEARAQQRLAAL